MLGNSDWQRFFGFFLISSVLALGLVMFLDSLLGDTFISLVQGAGSSQTVTSTVVVGNATPSISGAVVLNHSTSLVMTANTTTNVDVNVTIVDNNGCNDILNGTRTIMIYRSGISSSTCLSTASDRNCYRVTAFTATSSCQSNTTIVSTTTFSVQYFADATDASSSFASQCWLATVNVTDSAGATTTADSAFSEPTCDLLTLTALNVTTSSINYGTMAASSTSQSTNQTATTTNAGNSSTTLQLRANSTLTFGTSSIPTSSQRFSTSSFTWAGTSTALTDTLATVSGFLLTSPTSTTNVVRPTYWGIEIPSGLATGTYSGVTLFSALFQP